MVYLVLNTNWVFPHCGSIHIIFIDWLCKGVYLCINIIVSYIDICVADIICVIDGIDIVEIITQSEYH